MGGEDRGTGVWGIVGVGDGGRGVFCGVKSLGGDGVGDGGVRLGKGGREELGVEVGGKIWLGVDVKCEVLKEVTFSLN